MSLLYHYVYSSVFRQQQFCIQAFDKLQGVKNQ